MPKYLTEIRREVVTIERVFRVIEAPNIIATCTAADQLAPGFDASCPDDVETVSEECRQWLVQITKPATDQDIAEHGDEEPPLPVA